MFQRVIQNNLKKSGFVSVEQCGTWAGDDTGLKVGFILFPLDNNNGTLEDLCLRILSEKNSKNILSAVDEFFEDMETTYGRVYRRKHKNRLHTYLPSSDEYGAYTIKIAFRLNDLMVLQSTRNH